MTVTIAKATPTAENFTFTAPADLTYNGEAKEATVAAKSGVTGMGAITVMHSETSPTNVGEYTVSIDVAEGDNYLAATGLTDNSWGFAIATAPITPGVSIEGWTYGETAKEPEVTGNTGNGTVTYQYKVKDASDDTYTTDVPENAGTYTVRANVAATANYGANTATADFTIGKATIAGTVTIADIDQPVTGTELDTEATVSELTGVSGSAVTWSPVTTPAAGNTVYTATIALTADDNHQFSGSYAATVNGNNASTNIVGGKLQVSYTFVKTQFTVSIDDAIVYGTVSADKLTPEVGETVTLTVTPDAGYSLGTLTVNGTAIEGTAFEMPNDNAVVSATFTANTNTAYQVKHYLQQADGSYPTEPNVTENLTGTTDTETAAAAKTEYEHYTVQSFEQATIAGNGLTVIEIRYARDEYSITFDSDGGSEVATITKVFGADVTAPTVPTKDGLVFSGWYDGDSEYTFTTMPIGGKQLKANWAKQGKVVDDGSDEISTSDLSAVINLAMGRSGNYNRYAADFDGDGRVTIADVVKMVNIILGLDNGSARRRAATAEPELEVE